VNVPPDCLPKMWRFMEQHQTIGLLGPKMLGVDGRGHRSGMRFPTIWNVFLRALSLDSVLKGPGILGGYLMTDFHFDQIRDVEVLNGWFWMTRREALDQVGLLDERFFMYGEDIDWCKRFHLAGWRIVFYPEAEALHYGGASSSKEPARFCVELQRANLQYWRKYHSRISLFFYLLAVWLSHALRLIGWGFVYLVKRSSRSKASFEVRQNCAGMHWLLGLKSVREAGEQ
jgi:GT2 family glycosyltransferase